MKVFRGKQKIENPTQKNPSASWGLHFHVGAKIHPGK